MATYDLAYPGAAIDAILNTAYFLQEAGYIFQGSASEYSGTPSKRVWLIAPAGFTGLGLSSSVPQGSFGICLYNGTAWVGKVINVLTLDSAPTRNSQNGVTSGGVAATLDEIAGGIMETFASLLFDDETAAADLSTKLSYAVKFSVSDVYQTVTHLNILAATTSKAGLMSAEDKAKVDSFLTNLRSLTFTDTTASADQGTQITETLKATIGGVQEVIDSITLLAATSSKAGLLSASDKAYIDALPATLTNLSNSISGALALMQSLVGYYVCDTAAGTAAKTVDGTGYSLTNGGCIRIKMNNANTADNVTLNINSTGAKALYYDGAQASSSNSWEAGEVLEVYYDGTQYQCASGSGGKFATGEKVRETSITDEVTENSTALPTGGAVFQAMQDLSEVCMKEDEAKVISDALNELKENESNTMGKNEALVLASALNDLNTRIEEGGGGGGSSSAYPFSGEVTIANSERISVVGSSFGTGSFNLAGKAWHAKLALFSDYQFENISYDGFNYISILRYLRLKQISFSGRYALLCNNENDHGLSLAYQLKSLENIATWMKVFGAEPILATSYTDFSYRSDLWREHARKNNYMFWDAAKYCSMIRGAKNGAWDGARHLATRNSQMVSDAYMPYMLAMERPMQSIKVFRLRSFVNYANLDDLMFKDNIRRAELFMELYFGNACNKIPSSVDDISHCVNGGLVDEYRSLRGSGVLFSAPFLISAVIPVNASDLSMLQLVMSAGKAVKVYVMNRKEPPFPEGGTYTRFSVLNEIDSPEQGAVYSTGGTNYTVVSVVYGENGYHYTMYCSPAISSSMGSGTLTKVSGNGPASIPFQIAEQSSLGGTTIVDTDTVGHWVEVAQTGSSYAISGTLLSNCVEIDTIHFLVIPQDTDCLISNISVKYGGSKMKKSSTRVYYDFENSDFFESSELVQEPTFGAVGTTLTHWTDKEGSTLTSIADYENKYPKGQSVVNVSNSVGMKQTIPSSSLRSGRYVLQVISRYFPPIYTDGSGNQITPDSYDFETLNVTISNGGELEKTAMLTDIVGTYWKISQFDVDLFTADNVTITIDSGVKGLEICYVSLKRKEY